MATSTDYKGYKVLTPEPAKEGGQDLNYNFKKAGDDVESINADLALQPLVLTPVTLGNAIVIDDSTDISSSDLRGTYAVDLQSADSKTNVNQVASGDYSSILGGIKNVASGARSCVTGGELNIASGVSSHAEGEATTAKDYAAHSEGRNTIASAVASHSEGYLTVSSADYSHAEGIQTTSAGIYSHAEGYGTLTIGQSCHSEGFGSTAIGNYSHAEGYQTTAKDFYCHSEGQVTISIGYAGHSEGASTVALGNYSHAEGYNTTTVGDNSHSEGSYTTAIGANSHAEGSYTTAIGANSHAEGIYSVAKLPYEHAFSSGTFSYNIGDIQGSRIVAYGTTTNATPKSIYPGNSSANRLVISTDSTWTFSILIVARNADADEAAGYRLEGVIDNTGGTVSLVGSVSGTVIAEDDASWDATCIADNTNKSLEVKVTGSAGLSTGGVLWVAVVNLAKVSGTGIAIPS